MFFFVLFTTGCTEQILPTDFQGTPIFSVTGEIDGVPFDLTAGVNSNLTTNISSPVLTNTLEGTFDCMDCSEQLNFSFLATSSIIDDVIKVGAYAYRTLTVNNTNTIYIVTFTPEIQGGTMPYTLIWDFGDGVTSSTENVTLSHTYATAGGYPVTLIATDANGLKATMSAVINTNGTFNCRANFHIDSVSLQPTIYTFYSNTLIGGNSTTFSWMAQSGGIFFTNPDSMNIVTFFANNANAPLEVSLHTVKSNGCNSSMSQTYQQDLNTIQTFSARYQFSVNTVTTGDSTITFPITINYTDDNGTSYSTQNGEQHSDSYFEILAIDEFEPNEQGLKSKKLTIRFACQLFDNQGNVKNLNNGTGVIGIAYE